MDRLTANPPPLDAAARDELARKAKLCIDQDPKDRWFLVDTMRSTMSLTDAEFIAACSPDVILALLAAVERGAEDTARLDWMQEQADGLARPDYPRKWRVDSEGHATHYTPLQGGTVTLRAAIDAARATPTGADDAE